MTTFKKLRRPKAVTVLLQSKITKRAQLASVTHSPPLKTSVPDSNSLSNKIVKIAKVLDLEGLLPNK